MAKKAKAKDGTVMAKPKWKLCQGVGFNSAPNEYGGTPTTYVVLSCSIVDGVDVHGPFLTAAAAHEYIRTESERENYQRHDAANVPGLSWRVKFLDLPVQWDYC